MELSKSGTRRGAKVKCVECDVLFAEPKARSGTALTCPVCQTEIVVGEVHQGTTRRRALIQDVADSVADRRHRLRVVVRASVLVLGVALLWFYRDALVDGAKTWYESAREEVQRTRTQVSPSEPK